MAGIGFELEKLFRKKGVFAQLKAYGYAGIICTGPMILGIALLIGMYYIGEMAGLSEHEQNWMNSMITYTLLASMLTNNTFAMLMTRYTADSLYEEKNEKVIPSLYGSLNLMLVVGGVLYAAFLCVCGLPFHYAILNFMFYEEMVIVWTQINYLTAIKDYKGILIAFAVALICGLGVGYILTCICGFPVITTLLGCICIAYGSMIVCYHILLRKFFPVAKGCRADFLRYIEKYPTLIGCGIFMSIGLYGHLVLMWFSSFGIQIKGIYYGAPQYDVPALVAFLSTLITSINFVTTVEVNFYPKYRAYYSLFNDEGTLKDIEYAEHEMQVTIQNELAYNAAKQVFTTIFFVVFGSLLLPVLPLGFNEEMLGIFRILCLGYAFFAIGNSFMLMSLYFSDEQGAYVDTAIFAIGTVSGTFFFIDLPVKYYGLGFVIGSFAFMVVAIIRLWYYQRKLLRYVLLHQPMIQTVQDGVFTKIADKAQTRWEQKTVLLRNGKKERK